MSTRGVDTKGLNWMSDYRPLLKAFYLVAVVLIVVPVSEHVAQVLPFRFANPTWRFGAEGLFSGSLPGLLLGLGLILSLAAALKHRRTVRVVGALSVVIALLLVVVLVMFGLDFIQVRATVNPRMKSSLDLTVIRALLIIGLSALTAAIVGVAAWRSSRPDRRTESARSPGLIYRTQEGGNVATAGAGESVVASAGDSEPNQEEGRSR